MADDVFATITDERLHLVSLLADLPSTTWSEASLCEGWTVRDVLAHLVWILETPLTRVFVQIARRRGDFNRVARDAVTRDRRGGPDLVRAYRALAERRFSPPVHGPQAPLADVIIHSFDICRPLAIPYEVPGDRLRLVLDYLVSPRAARGFVTKGLLAGVRVEATDLDWSFGTGVLVTGSATSLMLAIAGRTVALDDLGGEGVNALANRLT